MSPLIVATSGFILPENSYFEPFEVKDDVIESIFNRSVVSVVNKDLLQFYSDRNVYKSDLINKSVLEYMSKKDFDSFINLVNICVDILKPIGFLEFFKLQAGNKYLSNLSFKFCLDCVDMSILYRYNDYSVVPFNIRFTMADILTEQESVTRLKQIDDRYNRSVKVFGWEEFFAHLTTNKDAFFTFFKYVFADYY